MSKRDGIDNTVEDGLRLEILTWVCKLLDDETTDSFLLDCFDDFT